MSLIQDKFGNEFLRSNGGMEPGFGPGMLMFSHLPPVTSFTRLASQTVMADLQPHEMILKKERDSPDCGGGLNYVHAMGIKQEKSAPNPIVSLLSFQLSGRLVKESSGRKGRRSNGEGQEAKTRRKRGESKSMMLDPDGGSLSPNSKPHICEHCSAAFRSSYHLRRHVLIHTGERPFRCTQCNMSFIQKYLLQRHEKIHSGEKPFSCDQCNMRFIQKYHMERHKRTHSGEKPYKCDTCQQYFSRTDRLLKHKRTCGDAIKKGVDGAEHELGSAGDGEHGSYGISQGNAATPSRKRGKTKNAGEGGERKRKKSSGTMGVTHCQGVDNYGVHDFGSAGNHMVSTSSSAQPGPSMHGEHGRAPKMPFKKGNRKFLEKNTHPMDQSKPGGMELPAGGGLDSLELLQGSGAKVGPSSSNYDDAMQFLKKRRYLHVPNSGGAASGASDYDVSVSHLQSQPTVIQGVVSGVLDGDAALGLLDSSPLGDIKQDKSGIPDEVLQSLLDHYAHKPEVTFDITDPHHVELQPATTDATDPLGTEDTPSSPNSGDKAVIMHEYSRFLLQALERTSHSASFPLGSSPGSAVTTTGAFSGPSPLLSDKHVYTSSPLEYSYSQPVSSSPSLSSVPKSHFGLLEGSSPPTGFHLSSLEPHTQQLTPSQELTEQLDKQHTSPPPPPHTPNTNAYQITPQPPDLGGPKESQGPKNGATATTGGFSLAASQDLVTLDPAKAPYQIENFAQAFGAQFKGGRVSLAFSSDSVGEVTHRLQTSVSEFSGYSSLLADASDPVSSGSKTPTSQSYR
uniref:Zinc finger protein 281 n=1 Tax=Cyprinus carpio TaxID=7962 RepID=A0A8C1QI55_CYPCA